MAATHVFMVGKGACARLKRGPELRRVSIDASFAQ